MLVGQIAINANWPDFNAILIFTSGGLAIGALLALILMCFFFKIRRLTASVALLQSAGQTKVFATQLPLFIYKQVPKDETIQYRLYLQWNHATFVLNLMILTVLFVIVLKIICKHFSSHIPWIYAEITTVNDCILLPIVRLPLCSTQCLIQVPSSITNLKLDGTCLSSNLKVSWPDFYVLNG